jgi:hypothetical protein
MAKIFSLKDSLPGGTAITDGGWCQFLNDNGVRWSSKGKTSYDNTFTVNIPCDGFYNIRASVDDQGTVWWDGNQIISNISFKNEHRADRQWLTAGNHSLRVWMKDNGGNWGGAVIVETDEVTIFNLRGQPGSWNIDNGGWCDFLRQNGVWFDNGNSIDRTYTVNFPVDAYYHFRASCDNYGTVWLDGAEIVKINDFKKEYSATVLVKAGNHTVRVYGKDTGGGKGIAFTIDGDIQTQVANKGSADYASSEAARKQAEADKLAADKAALDKAAADAKAAETKAANDKAVADGKVVEAKWIVVPVESVTFQTDLPGGFSASATAEAKASAEASAGASYTSTSAEAHAGVSAGASLEAGASVGNEYVGCDVRVWVSVEAVAEAGASAGLDGNNAYITAGVNCTVRAEAGAAVGIHAGPAGADASGCVFVESGAKAEMVVEVGQNGAKLEGGMSIGTAVGVEGEGTVTFSGASGTAGAGVEFGEDNFAIGGGGQAQFKEGHLCLGVSGDVAVFAGLEVDLAVDIDTNKCIKDAVYAYNEAVKISKQAEKVYNDAVKLANKTAKDAEKITNQAVNDARKAANDAAKFATDTANQANKVANDAIKATEKSFTDAGYTISNGVVKLGNDIASGAVNLGNDIVKAFSSVPAPKKCVVATELTRQRMWSKTEYLGLTKWSEDKLDKSFIGRCLHYGYPVVANRTFIPAIKRKGSLMAKYYKWTFENGVAMLRGNKYDWKALPSFALWILVMTIVGLFITKEQHDKI